VVGWLGLHERSFPSRFEATNLAGDGGIGIIGRLELGSYEATIPASYLLGRRRDSKLLLVRPMTRVR
jgi:hypothetical protein